MKTKLPNHISISKSGKYRVRYQKSSKYPFSFDESFNTLDEAIKAKNEYLAKNTLNMLSNNSNKKIGFSNFCNYYLERIKNKTKKLSPNTIRGYKSKIDQLVLIFGNQDISSISSYQIETALNKEKTRNSRTNGIRENKKITSYTLHHEYTMLRILFNKAKKWNFVDNNPMDDVDEPEYEVKKIQVPEYSKLDEIKNKIYTTSIRERCQFLLTLYTGIREEEVCGVHIEDFNREELYISIKRAIVQDQETKSFIESKTKSQSSVRKIPLPVDFFEVLDEYLNTYRKVFISALKYKTNGNYKEIPNVFLNKDGDFYRPHRVGEKWKAFASSVGLNLTFHGLRHYYITNQMNYNDDLSPRDVQELAGHSNIKTTYGYVHSSQERINKYATTLFTTFSKDNLYKYGNDTLSIPITHIATIITGDPKYSKVEDLNITLEELNDEKVDYFNMSYLLEQSKKYLINNYPALSRIEKYKYYNTNEDEIIKQLKKEFGKEFVVDKYLNKNISI